MFNTLGSLGHTNPHNQSTVPNLNLISLFEKELQYIAQEHIQQLSRKIYPVQMSISNCYQALYRTLVNYFSIQTGKGNSYQIITSDIARYASSISEALSLKLSDIFKRDEVKKKIFEIIKRTSPSETQTNSHFLQPSKSHTRGMYSTTLLESLGGKYGEDGTNKYGNLLNKQLNETFRKENATHLDASASVAQKYMREKISIENLMPRIQFQRELREMNQFNNKKCLICDSLLITNESSRKGLFQCKDCHEIYHKKCMPRDNNCCICQLMCINPLQKSKNILFVGLLKKGTKKHEIEFQLKKEHQEYGPEQKEKNGKKSSIPSIELRCMRLKDKNDAVANFINLFPDACTVMVNNRLIKQFQPLHKQSSLKYRRDECLKISSNINIGVNKITVTERILKRQIKTDERIEPENHLLIVCIAESLQVPKPANKLEQFLTKSGYMTNNQNSVEKFLLSMDSKVTIFGQSQNLLKKSMFIASKQEGESQEQQIACDNLKVPLVCSLTLQKMKYPGRSIFCKHFACFDIYNFVLLNAQAKLPKWQCPICKASAYKFQIDCIMKSIVNELQKIAENRKSKEQEEPTQVQFDMNFGVRFLNCEGKDLVNKKSKTQRTQKTQFLESESIPHWLLSIYELPIEGKAKRERQSKEEGQCSKKNQLSLDSFISESEQSIKLINQSKPQQFLRPSLNILEKEVVSPQPEQMDEQKKQLQLQDVQEALEQDMIQKMPRENFEFCNFKVLIDPMHQAQGAVSSVSIMKKNQDVKKNDFEDQKSLKEKQNKIDGNYHSPSKQHKQQKVVQEEGQRQHLCGQNYLHLGEDHLFEDQEGLSSEDLELERALNQYEQQRKLKSLFKSDTGNNGQDTNRQKQQNDMLQEDEKMNEFHFSYQSFPADIEPEIQPPANAVENPLVNQNLIVYSKENQIPSAQDSQQRRKPQIRSQIYGEEIQNEMQQKNNEIKIKKADINLFKGYSTVNSSETGRKKLTKGSQSSRKAGMANKNKSGCKEKDRKGRDRDKGKCFELPQDADIIQLSD